MNLLRWLLGFFTLGATPEGDPPADPPAEPTETGETEGEGTEGGDEGEEGEEDDSLEALLGRQPEPTAGPKKSKREIELEEELAAAKRDGQAKPLPIADADWEREEAQLADARQRGNADEIRNLEWAVNTNRTLRQNKRTSDMALFQAAEMADKQEFRDLRHDNPALYDRYKDRVEKELADLRRGGRTVPRLTMLDYLVGKDIREGKIKSKSRKQAKPLPDNVTRIERGRSPTMRSDTHARGRLSKKQELEKRLTGKFI